MFVLGKRGAASSMMLVYRGIDVVVCQQMFLARARQPRPRWVGVDKPGGGTVFNADACRCSFSMI